MFYLTMFFTSVYDMWTIVVSIVNRSRPRFGQHCQPVPPPVDKLPIEKNRRGTIVMSAHPHLTV